MSNSSFDITDASSFFEIMVKPQYEAFLKNNASVKDALLSTILVYHIYEWANSGEKFTIDQFNETYPENTKISEYLEMARDITNGLKHFKTKKTTTRRQSGFSSAYSNAYARPLIVISSEGSETSVDDLLKSLIEFWENQIKA